MTTRVLLNPDHIKARAYFRRILSYSQNSENVRLAIIAHLVDSAVPFIPSLADRFQLQAILGKPSSIQPNVREHLLAKFPELLFELNKEKFREHPEHFIAEAFPENRADKKIQVVLLDIGGYFTPISDTTQEPGLLRVQRELTRRGYELVGIVEDTMNGHKRYEAVLKELSENLRFSVFSVAKSPLKKPENHLVGVAITFSIEALLRKSNIVLQSRRAGVIGFGPIGSSVAHTLRNRGVPVSVCENNPIRLAVAAAQGFRVYHYSHHFEDFTRGINLIVSATGAGADGGHRPLDSEHVRWLQSGTFVASVTSADDEINLAAIRAGGYLSSRLSYNEDVEKWASSPPNGGLPHHFYLMLQGNAVNFKHEGVIGPAIQLLQGEIIACVNKILTGADQSKNIVQELTENERKMVANAWLDQYLTDSAVSS